MDYNYFHKLEHLEKNVKINCMHIINNVFTLKNISLFMSYFRVFFLIFNFIFFMIHQA